MYYYMLTFILEFACCFSLYLLQLNLSLLFFNQMIPLVVGLCGSLLGLVLMYIKMYSFLPWGGFLSCALVGMDWNVETPPLKLLKVFRLPGFTASSLTPFPSTVALILSAPALASIRS